MTGESDEMLRLEDALSRVLDGARPLPLETVTLEDAQGQVLAVPVVATTSLPPWDNSAMDGFAVRSADVADASPDSPVRLRVLGEVAAGHAPDRGITAGSAMRITTGAMVPSGADAVVPVEETDAPGGVSALPPWVAVRAPAAPGAHLRYAGADVRLGERVLDTGRLVGPAALALAAASGAAQLAVHRRPRVGILATGDELSPAGEPLGPCRIYDSNTPALLAQARVAGAIAVSYGIVPDDPVALRERLAVSVAASDVVVLSGGVSVGAHDHVRDAFRALGDLALWRVAISARQAARIRPHDGRPCRRQRGSGPFGCVIRAAGKSGQRVRHVRAIRAAVAACLAGAHDDRWSCRSRRWVASRAHRHRARRRRARRPPPRGRAPGRGRHEGAGPAGLPAGPSGGRPVHTGPAHSQTRGCPRLPHAVGACRGRRSGRDPGSCAGTSRR